MTTLTSDRAFWQRNQLVTHADRRRYGITDASPTFNFCPGCLVCPLPIPPPLEHQYQLTMLRLLAFLSLLLGFVPYISYAQSSCTQLAPSAGIRPALASGYQMQVVATGLSDPRGILLDGAGNLLVVEQSRGVVSCHKISEDNGCVSLEDPTDLTQNIGVSRTTILRRLS